MMTHEEALNKILANSCTSEPDADGFQEYVLTMHCHSALVVAKPLGDENGNGIYKYEIKSVTIGDEEDDRFF